MNYAPTFNSLWVVTSNIVFRLWNNVEGISQKMIVSTQFSVTSEYTSYTKMNLIDCILKNDDEWRFENLLDEIRHFLNTSAFDGIWERHVLRRLMQWAAIYRNSKWNTEFGTAGAVIKNHYFTSLRNFILKFPNFPKPHFIPEFPLWRLAHLNGINYIFTHPKPPSKKSNYGDVTWN